MRTKLIALSIMLWLCILVGCAFRLSHFGVENYALFAPSIIGETESVVERAEMSPGAQYCPEKIAQARELGRRGVAVYWSYRKEEEAMTLLARARKLAQEAELCEPPPAPQTKELFAGVPDPPPTPVIPSLPPEPGIPKPPPLKRLVLRGINFAFNSYELSFRAHAILDKELDILQEVPYAKFEIAGHADSIGSEVYNQILSEKRAESVKYFLVSRGVSKARITVMGYGESVPIASNDTDEGRAKNRRVEMNIMR